MAYAADHPRYTIRKFGSYLMLWTLGGGELGRVRLDISMEWGEEVAVKQRWRKNIAPCSHVKDRGSERGTLSLKSNTSSSHLFMKANVLINRDRRACITDFGLTAITGVTNRAAVRASRASFISSDSLMSFTTGGTYRWMSPELLDPERFGMPESEDSRPTRQSDCYALGIVIYEARIRTDKSVIEGN